MPLDPCFCPIRPGMTREELLEEIYIPKKNCCHPYHICATLDREMRRAEKESYSRKYIAKRKGSTVSPRRPKISNVLKDISFLD